LKNLPQKDQSKHSESDRTVIVIVWQSLVVASYRSFFEYLAHSGKFEVALVAPSRFRELGMQQVECEPFHPVEYMQSFILDTLTLHTQAVWYKRLFEVLRLLRRKYAGRRTVVISMSEPYSFTTLGIWFISVLALGRRWTFGCFALQNIFKRFSFPIRLVQSYLFSHLDFVLTLGREHQEVLRKHGYQKRCLDFPLWFDSAKFSLTYEKSDPVIRIGFLGSLVEEKGVSDLLECVSRYRNVYRNDIAIHIAGRGRQQEMVQEAIRTLSAAGVDAKYIGPLNSAEVADFFKNLDILVVPSRTRHHWKEQFGRVIIEAMACGCSVIGSSSGEIPTVVQRHANIFAEGDIDSLHKALTAEIARIRGSGPDVRIENSKLAQKFSDRTCARQFAAALETI
jgi:glycosyltransferase involved in cell wall biosynthesis